MLKFNKQTLSYTNDKVVSFVWNHNKQKKRWMETALYVNREKVAYIVQAYYDECPGYPNGDIAKDYPYRIKIGLPKNPKQVARILNHYENKTPHPFLMTDDKAKTDFSDMVFIGSESNYKPRNLDLVQMRLWFDE